MSNQGCIDACNKLLRGELSAIETYSQAQDKFHNQPEEEVLVKIRSFHSSNANKLREHIVSMHGKPSDSSGAWGTFAKAIEGGAKLLGETAALQALIAGEEHGIQEYQDALKDTEVMAEIKEVIRRDLIPDLRSNVSALQQLQNA